MMNNTSALRGYLDICPKNIVQNLHKTSINPAQKTA